jgi:hypothetical protein
VLADDGGLAFKVLGHLSRDSQKGINRLSALAESLLRKLAAPVHSEVRGLHCTFAAVLREV